VKVLTVHVDGNRNTPRPHVNGLRPHPYVRGAHHAYATVQRCGGSFHVGGEHLKCSHRGNM
jgi:hypothetical protein